MTDFQQLERVVGRKTDATAKTTDVVQAIDSALQVPVIEGVTYQFEATLISNADADADIDFGLSYPAGTTGDYCDLDAPATPIAIGAELTIAGTAANVRTRISGSFVAGADGTFGITWAQNASDAGETILKAGSVLRVTNCNA